MTAKGPSGKRKINWAMVEELIDKFGAEFMINMREHQERPIGRVRLDCLKANQRLAFHPDALSDGLHEYEFPTYPKRARVVAVWDRFYPSTHQARGILTRALASGGVLRDEIAHVWAVPKPLSHPPLAQDIAAFRMDTEYAIEAANCQHVLLLGSGTIKMWRSDLKVTELLGRTYVWKNRWFIYPSLNPMAIVADQSKVEDWRKSMQAISQGIHDGHVELVTWCYECGKEAEVWDESAVGWCKEHFKFNNVTNREKAWNKQIAKTQPGLLTPQQLEQLED